MVPALVVNIFDPVIAPFVIAIAIIGSNPLAYVPLGLIFAYAAYRLIRA